MYVCQVTGDLALKFWFADVNDDELFCGRDTGFALTDYVYIYAVDSDEYRTLQAEKSAIEAELGPLRAKRDQQRVKVDETPNPKIRVCLWCSRVCAHGLVGSVDADI